MHIEVGRGTRFGPTHPAPCSRLVSSLDYNPATHTNSLGEEATTFHALIMSYGDIEEPPAKKRRFFDSSAENEPASLSSTFDATVVDLTSPTKRDGPRRSVSPINKDEASREHTSQDGPSDGLDVSLFKGVVGDISQAVIQSLRDASGNNTERAINMYLDGSWQQTPVLGSSKPSPHTPVPDAGPSAQKEATVIQHTRADPKDIECMPLRRYIGAFGVAAWATRSGTGLIKHGEEVKVDRTKPKQSKLGRGGKPLPVSRQRADVIVRFTNRKGEEVGRLPQETASWVSSLLDQHVCYFEGHCVYAPDRVRINDTIYLQLRCYMEKRTFEAGAFVKPLENNRNTGIFEEKETNEEQELRLRQVSLVKLFSEINLHPVASNEANENHKREGLLQAAESAEQKDAETPPKSTSSGTSTPQGGEEENEDGKELEQDQLDSLYKKAQSFDFDTPIREPASSFRLQLRKYQKQALHWMASKEQDQQVSSRESSIHPLWEEYAWPVKDVDDQELPTVKGQGSFYVNPYSGELSLDFPAQEQHCLGGILADEMGLGKTIECLSLIHTNCSEVDLKISTSPPSSINNLPRLPKRGVIESAPCTTLVVAPMSLLAQWESEAAKASQAGSLKVLMYYGIDKAANLQNLCCEANAASAPNLVITSYGIVLSEFNQVASRGGDRATHGGIFSLDFHRCILDEAHFIKNRQSKTAKACYELSAKHRWVLTGTPIVNRLEDLFSLVRFLRVEPWSNFSFWKTFITVPFESGNFIRALNVVQTVLEPLVIRRTKDMKTPDGMPLVPLPPRIIDVEEIRLSKAEQEVYDWIYTRAKRTFNANVQAGTLLKSYTTIFAQLLRLRQSCCHPILTRNKDIVADEVEANAASDIANGLADDMDLQTLIERFETGESEQDANRFGAHVLKQIQEESENECPICAEESMVDPVVTGCWHSACKKCLLDYIEHEKDKQRLPLCVNCREPINPRDLFEVIRHDDLEVDGPQSSNIVPSTHSSGSGSTPLAAKRISLRRLSAAGSAKIVALISHLRRLRRVEPAAKVVVFSQFTSFLDLITPALQREGIPSLRFDGAMNQRARAQVLERFADLRAGGTVLMLSLRAGGVGLNLTAARRVFMMDPWWSFAVEAQAIDRVHRMGQEGEVRVVRFVVEGSIERRMLKVQERKKFM